MNAIEAAQAYATRRRNPEQGIHVHAKGDEFWATARFKNTKSDNPDIEFVFTGGNIKIIGDDGRWHDFDRYE